MDSKNIDSKIQAALLQAASAENIGIIKSLTGKVFIIDENGNKREAKIGDVIKKTDIVDTSQGSYELLPFNENTIRSLFTESELSEVDISAILNPVILIKKIYPEEYKENEGLSDAEFLERINNPQTEKEAAAAVEESDGSSSAYVVERTGLNDSSNGSGTDGFNVSLTSGSLGGEGYDTESSSDRIRDALLNKNLTSNVSAGSDLTDTNGGIGIGIDAGTLTPTLPEILPKDPIKGYIDIVNLDSSVIKEVQPGGVSLSNIKIVSLASIYNINAFNKVEDIDLTKLSSLKLNIEPSNAIQISIGGVVLDKTDLNQDDISRLVKAISSSGGSTIADITITPLPFFKQTIRINEIKFSTIGSSEIDGGDHQFVKGFNLNVDAVGSGFDFKPQISDGKLTLLENQNKGQFSFKINGDVKDLTEKAILTLDLNFKFHDFTPQSVISAFALSLPQGVSYSIQNGKISLLVDPSEFNQSGAFSKDITLQFDKSYFHWLDFNSSKIGGEGFTKEFTQFIDGTSSTDDASAIVDIDDKSITSTLSPEDPFPWPPSGIFLPPWEGLLPPPPEDDTNPPGGPINPPDDPSIPPSDPSIPPGGPGTGNTTNVDFLLKETQSDANAPSFNSSGVLNLSAIGGFKQTLDLSQLKSLNIVADPNLRFFIGDTEITNSLPLDRTEIMQIVGRMLQNGQTTIAHVVVTPKAYAKGELKITEIKYETTNNQTHVHDDDVKIGIDVVGSGFENTSIPNLYDLEIIGNAGTGKAELKFSIFMQTKDVESTSVTLEIDLPFLSSVSAETREAFLLDAIPANSGFSAEYIDGKIIITINKTAAEMASKEFRQDISFKFDGEYLKYIDFKNAIISGKATTTDTQDSSITGTDSSDDSSERIVPPTPLSSIAIIDIPELPPGYASILSGNILLKENQDNIVDLEKGDSVKISLAEIYDDANQENKVGSFDLSQLTSLNIEMSPSSEHVKIYIGNVEIPSSLTHNSTTMDLGFPLDSEKISFIRSYLEANNLSTKADVTLSSTAFSKNTAQITKFEFDTNINGQSQSHAIEDPVNVGIDVIGSGYNNAEIRDTNLIVPETGPVEISFNVTANKNDLNESGKIVIDIGLLAKEDVLLLQALTFSIPPASENPGYSKVGNTLVFEFPVGSESTISKDFKIFIPRSIANAIDFSTSKIKVQGSTTDTQAQRISGKQYNESDNTSTSSTLKEKTLWNLFWEGPNPPSDPGNGSTYTDVNTFKFLEKQYSQKFVNDNNVFPGENPGDALTEMFEANQIEMLPIDALRNHNITSLKFEHTPPTKEFNLFDQDGRLITLNSSGEINLANNSSLEKIFVVPKGFSSADFTMLITGKVGNTNNYKTVADFKVVVDDVVSGINEEQSSTSMYWTSSQPFNVVDNKKIIGKQDLNIDVNLKLHDMADNSETKQLVVDLSDFLSSFSSSEKEEILNSITLNVTKDELATTGAYNIMPYLERNSSGELTGKLITNISKPANINSILDMTTLKLNIKLENIDPYIIFRGMDPDTTLDKVKVSVVSREGNKEILQNVDGFSELTPVLHTIKSGDSSKASIDIKASLDAISDKAAQHALDNPGISSHQVIASQSVLELNINGDANIDIASFIKDNLVPSYRGDGSPSSFPDGFSITSSNKIIISGQLLANLFVRTGGMEFPTFQIKAVNGNTSDFVVQIKSYYDRSVMTPDHVGKTNLIVVGNKPLTIDWDNFDVEPHVVMNQISNTNSRLEGSLFIDIKNIGIATASSGDKIRSLSLDITDVFKDGSTDLLANMDLMLSSNNIAGGWRISNSDNKITLVFTPSDTNSDIQQILNSPAFKNLSLAMKNTSGIPYNEYISIMQKISNNLQGGKVKINELEVFNSQGQYDLGGDDNTQTHVPPAGKGIASSGTDNQTTSVAAIVENGTTYVKESFTDEFNKLQELFAGRTNKNHTLTEFLENSGYSFDIELEGIPSTGVTLPITVEYTFNGQIFSVGEYDSSTKTLKISGQQLADLITRKQVLGNNFGELKFKFVNELDDIAYKTKVTNNANQTLYESIQRIIAKDVVQITNEIEIKDPTLSTQVINIDKRTADSAEGSVTIKFSGNTGLDITDGYRIEIPKGLALDPSSSIPTTWEMQSEIINGEQKLFLVRKNPGTPMSSQDFNFDLTFVYDKRNTLGDMFGSSASRNLVTSDNFLKFIATHTNGINNSQTPIESESSYTDATSAKMLNSSETIVSGVKYTIDSIKFAVMSGEIETSITKVAGSSNVNLFNNLKDLVSKFSMHQMLSSDTFNLKTSLANGSQIKIDGKTYSVVNGEIRIPKADAQQLLNKVIAAIDSGTSSDDVINAEFITGVGSGSQVISLNYDPPAPVDLSVVDLSDMMSKIDVTAQRISNIGNPLATIFNSDLTEANFVFNPATPPKTVFVKYGNGINDVIEVVNGKLSNQQLQLLHEAFKAAPNGFNPIAYIATDPGQPSNFQFDLRLKVYNGSTTDNSLLIDDAQVLVSPNSSTMSTRIISVNPGSPQDVLGEIEVQFKVRVVGDNGTAQFKIDIPDGLILNVSQIPNGWRLENNALVKNISTTADLGLQNFNIKFKYDKNSTVGSLFGSSSDNNTLIVDEHLKFNTVSRRTSSAPAVTNIVESDMSDQIKAFALNAAKIIVSTHNYESEQLADIATGRTDFQESRVSTTNGVIKADIGKALYDMLSLYSKSDIENNDGLTINFKGVPNNTTISFGNSTYTVVNGKIMISKADAMTLHDLAKNVISVENKVFEVNINFPPGSQIPQKIELGIQPFVTQDIVKMDLSSVFQQFENYIQQFTGTNSSNTEASLKNALFYQSNSDSKIEFVFNFGGAPQPEGAKIVLSAGATALTLNIVNGKAVLSASQIGELYNLFSNGDKVTAYMNGMKTSFSFDVRMQIHGNQMVTVVDDAQVIVENSGQSSGKLPYKGEPVAEVINEDENLLRTTIININQRTVNSEIGDITVKFEGVLGLDGGGRLAIAIPEGLTISQNSQGQFNVPQGWTVEVANGVTYLVKTRAVGEELDSQSFNFNLNLVYEKSNTLGGLFGSKDPSTPSNMIQENESLTFDYSYKRSNTSSAVPKTSDSQFATGVAEEVANITKVYVEANQYDLEKIKQVTLGHEKKQDLSTQVENGVIKSNLFDTIKNLLELYPKNLLIDSQGKFTLSFTGIPNGASVNINGKFYGVSNGKVVIDAEEALAIFAKVESAIQTNTKFDDVLSMTIHPESSITMQSSGYNHVYNELRINDSNTKPFVDGIRELLKNINLSDLRDNDVINIDLNIAANGPLAIWFGGQNININKSPATGLFELSGANLKILSNNLDNIGISLYWLHDHNEKIIYDADTNTVRNINLPSLQAKIYPPESIATDTIETTKISPTNFDNVSSNELIFHKGSAGDQILKKIQEFTIENKLSSINPESMVSFQISADAAGPLAFHNSSGGNFDAAKVSGASNLFQMSVKNLIALSNAISNGDIFQVSIYNASSRTPVSMEIFPPNTSPNTISEVSKTVSFKDVYTHGDNWDSYAIGINKTFVNNMFDGDLKEFAIKIHNYDFKTSDAKSDMHFFFSGNDVKIPLMVDPLDSSKAIIDFSKIYQPGTNVPIAGNVGMYNPTQIHTLLQQLKNLGDQDNSTGKFNLNEMQLYFGDMLPRGTKVDIDFTSTMRVNAINNSEENYVFRELTPTFANHTGVNNTVIRMEGDSFYDQIIASNGNSFPPSFSINNIIPTGTIMEFKIHFLNSNPMTNLSIFSKNGLFELTPAQVDILNTFKDNISWTGIFGVSNESPHVKNNLPLKIQYQAVKEDFTGISAISNVENPNDLTMVSLTTLLSRLDAAEDRIGDSILFGSTSTEAIFNFSMGSNISKSPTVYVRYGSGYNDVMEIPSNGKISSANLSILLDAYKAGYNPMAYLASDPLNPSSFSFNLRLNMYNGTTVEQTTILRDAEVLVKSTLSSLETTITNTSFGNIANDAAEIVVQFNGKAVMDTGGEFRIEIPQGLTIGTRTINGVLEPDLPPGATLVVQGDKTFISFTQAALSSTNGAFDFTARFVYSKRASAGELFGQSEQGANYLDTSEAIRFTYHTKVNGTSGFTSNYDIADFNQATSNKALNAVQLFTSSQSYTSDEVKSFIKSDNIKPTHGLGLVASDTIDIANAIRDVFKLYDMNTIARNGGISLNLSGIPNNTELTILGQKFNVTANNKSIFLTTEMMSKFHADFTANPNGFSAPATVSPGISITNILSEEITTNINTNFQMSPNLLLNEIVNSPRLADGSVAVTLTNAQNINLNNAFLEFAYPSGGHLTSAILDRATNRYIFSKETIDQMIERFNSVPPLTPHSMAFVVQGQGAITIGVGVTSAKFQIIKPLLTASIEPFLPADIMKLGTDEVMASLDKFIGMGGDLENALRKSIVFNSTSTKLDITLTNASGANANSKLFVSFSDGSIHEIALVGGKFTIGNSLLNMIYNAHENNQKVSFFINGIKNSTMMDIDLSYNTGANGTHSEKIVDDAQIIASAENTINVAGNTNSNIATGSGDDTVVISSSHNMKYLSSEITETQTIKLSFEDLGNGFVNAGLEQQTPGQTSTIQSTFISTGAGADTVFLPSSGVRVDVGGVDNAIDIIKFSKSNLTSSIQIPDLIFGFGKEDKIDFSGLIKALKAEGKIAGDMGGSEFIKNYVEVDNNATYKDASGEKSMTTVSVNIDGQKYNLAAIHAPSDDNLNDNFIY